MQLVPPEEVGVSSVQLARISQCMQDIVDQGQRAGIQILLSRLDEVCHFTSYGWQNREEGVAMDADTIFRIYSMTKPLVSVAIMILYEEGRLQLKDPVSLYLPAFADLQVYADEHTRQPLQRPILVHDLLTHTAGLSYGFLEDHPVDAMYKERGLPGYDLSDDEFIARLCQLPLASQPGTQWQYSVATDVLGVLVATVSGQSLGEFLAERIFQPLGMRDTTFQVPAEAQARLAVCYTHTEAGNLEPFPYLHPDHDPFIRDTFQSGGGGLAGTTADYLQFCRMLLHKGTLDGTRILGRKTVEFMTANHLPTSLLSNDGAAAGYGFGLGFRMLMDPPATRSLIGKGEYGWAGAADTYFWIDPAEEMIGLFMSQYMKTGFSHDAALMFQSLAYTALQE